MCQNHRYFRRKTFSCHNQIQISPYSSFNAITNHRNNCLHKYWKINKRIYLTHNTNKREKKNTSPKGLRETEYHPVIPKYSIILLRSRAMYFLRLFHGPPSLFPFVFPKLFIKSKQCLEINRVPSYLWTESMAPALLSSLLFH